MTPEQDLLRRAKTGDDQAFRLLIDRTRNAAWSAVCSLLPSNDLRSEAMQRGYIKTWEKLSQFEGKSAFTTWVVRIVVNEALMLLREEQRLAVRYPDVQLNDVMDDPALVADAEPEPVDARELREELQQALLTLSAPEQLAIRLFYMQGFSVKEVVSATGWSAVNTRVLLHRGRQSMREALEHIRKSKSRGESYVD